MVLGTFVTSAANLYQCGISVYTRSLTAEKHCALLKRHFSSADECSTDCTRVFLCPIFLIPFSSCIQP